MKRLLFLMCLLSASTLFAQDLTTRLDEFLGQYVTNRGFQGTVVVAENGTLLYARGFGLADPARGLQNGPQVQYHIASVTKTFTAAMIMKLVEQGKIGVHDPITKYLPAYRRDTGDRVTIHHLLTHTSGIPEFATTEARRAHGLEPVPPMDQLIEKYCSEPLAFEPGSKFAYSNTGFVLLGAIIQKVTSQTFDQALHTLILDPAGMKNSGLDCSGLSLPARAAGFDAGFGDTLPPCEVFNIDWIGAAGGMYATAEDMVAWDHALSDPAVLSRNALRLMQTPYVKMKADGPSYGYGAVLDRRVRNRKGDSLLVVYHQGGMPGVSSLFGRVPATKQMVFVVSNVSGAPVVAMSDGLFALVNGSPAPSIKPSLARGLFKAISTKGSLEGVRDIESEHRASPGRYDVFENELSILGHQYLREKKHDEAAAVFGYALRLFPKSAGAFNNMGECAVALDQKEKAIGFYKKSLELNPVGTTAREALQKLGVN
ncbi:MAG: serine hydrolase [Ignavibacteriae bacterium]|nr:serine hydrolase [Ignavibacteriota bacterium]